LGAFGRRSRFSPEGVTYVSLALSHSIVDNIFKPIRSIASSVFQNVAKPFAKEGIKSGVEHAGERLGKKAAEKSGDLIMKRLGNMRQKTPAKKARGKY